MRRLIIQAFGYLFAPAAKPFYRALAQPQRAQLVVKKRLIKQLKGCEYGRSHHIRTLADWHRLPIVNYEDLKPWIALSEKASNILTTEDILFYEPTSGSSGPIKQIPYTRALRRSFNRLFCIWAHDLITQGPLFSQGTLYFSITPSFSKATLAAGTTDDADYLDPWLRRVLQPFLVMAPPATPQKTLKISWRRPCCWPKTWKLFPFGALVF